MRDMPIDAVYRKGVIKPMKKLDLREDEEIEIEIRRKREVADELRGSIKGDKKRIDELVEVEVWELQ